MTVTHTQTSEAADATSPGMARVLLQRQIMPAGRDTDVIKLYVDPDPAALDADKFDIGHTRAAQEANAIAQRIQNAARGVSAIHPDQIESRTAYRVRQGDERLLRHLLQRLPRVLLAPLDDRAAGPAHRPAARRGRHGHGLPLDGQRPLAARRLRHRRGRLRRVLLRPAAQALRRRRLVLVRRRRRRRGRRRRERRVDRGGPRGPGPARHRHHRHHHHEPAGLLRQAAHPARRGRPARGRSSTRSWSWSRARTRSSTPSSSPRRRSPSVAGSGSSSRATSAARAASPGRSTRASRPAARRT